MNVEIGSEAVLFPEKEYISGIFVAVQRKQAWWIDPFKEESGKLNILYSTQEYSSYEKMT